MKDPVISVKDLLATCVKNAKLCVILAVVLGVALCGFKFVSDMNAQKKIADAKAQEEQKVELSKEELEEVDEYVDLVLLKDEIADFVDNSIYMNCNPFDIYFTEIEYDVQALTSGSQRDAVLALQNYVLGGMSADMSEISGDLEAKYYREVLSCEASGYESELDSGIVKIKLYAIDAKQAEEFAGLVDKAITAHVEALNAEGMQLFTVTKVYQVVSNELYESVIQYQADRKSLLETYEANVSSMEEGLSEKQLTEAFKILKIEDADVETEEAVVSASIDMRFLILGAIAGIALGVVLVAVKYVLTNTIKTTSDMQNMFGISSLGHITCKKLTIWDNLANKIFYSNCDFNLENEKQTIVSKIKVLCNKNDIKKVAIAASVEEAEKQQLEDISQKLSSNGISCDVFDVNHMDAFEKVENVVVIGKIGKTNYGTIENEILFYNDQNIKVLGYITVM